MNNDISELEQLRRQYNHLIKSSEAVLSRIDKIEELLNALVVEMGYAQSRVDALAERVFEVEDSRETYD